MRVRTLELSPRTTMMLPEPKGPNVPGCVSSALSAAACTLSVSR